MERGENRVRYLERLHKKGANKGRHRETMDIVYGVLGKSELGLRSCLLNFVSRMNSGAGEVLCLCPCVYTEAVLLQTQSFLNHNIFVVTETDANLCSLWRLRVLPLFLSLSLCV